MSYLPCDPAPIWSVYRRYLWKRLHRKKRETRRAEEGTPMQETYTAPVIVKQDIIATGRGSESQNSLPLPPCGFKTIIYYWFWSSKVNCVKKRQENQSLQRRHLTPLRQLLFSCFLSFVKYTNWELQSCTIWSVSLKSFEEPNCPQKTTQTRTTFIVRYNLASMYISSLQWVRQILFHTKIVWLQDKVCCVVDSK